MILKLENPENYKAKANYTDKVLKQIKSAHITKSKISGFDLDIKFADGSQKYDWSYSIRGAKHLFALYSKRGSKWIEEKHL